MAKNKSAEYWRERYKLTEEHLYNNYAYKNSEKIKKIFNSSLIKINKEIAVWLQRFADNNNITYAEATRLIGIKELEELGWNVEEYVKKGVDNQYTQLWDTQLENASARYHISRLEALKLQTIGICEKMYSDIRDIITDTMKKTYTDGYYGTAYEISKGFNVGINVAKINENLLNKIINKPWSDDGVEFSERIWGKYRPTLVNRLHRDLTDCVIRGINPQTLAADYAKEFKVSENAATNLLMTEYSQFASMSNTDCLNDLGVEEYEIVATLDNRTCGKCQNMDKKHFPLNKLKVEINAPPFHNRCRCTKCPYFDDEFTTNIKRAARDPETGKTIYVDDMSYTDWKERFVTEKGQQAWDYYEKSVKNKAADTKQYNKYKSVLGKNAPKSLEEFQKLKYTNSEEWDKIKSKVQEELPKMDFDRMELFVGTLSNRQTRLWYKYHDENIPNIIDKTKSLEEQAREACELRNTYRTQARDLMKDQEERKRLDSEHPNISFEELVEYKKLKYGLKGDAIYKDIIRSSQTTNKKYDKKAGLEE